jgi:PHD/YefM family antitoxin component YafN of YafNO toxin-antitoxin module
MSIHPQVIEKEGKKEFVVLPYEEFIALTEAVEDYEDLRTLRAEKAESGHEPVKTLDEVLREIGDTAPQD